MTRIDSMIVFNPNRDIVEDRKKKSGYGFKEISTVMTRTKLIIFLFEYLRDIDRPVLYFDYPRFSILWFVVIILSCFNSFFLVFRNIHLLFQPILFAYLLDDICVCTYKFILRFLDSSYYSTYQRNIFQRGAPK